MKIKSLCLIAFGILTLGYGNAQDAQVVQKQQDMVEWTLYSLIVSGNKIDVNTKEGPAFVLFGNKKFSGHTGCNAFFGNYQIKGNQLKISKAGSTRMMCEPEIMAVEDALLKLFAEDGSSIKLDGNILVLNKDSAKAVFTK